jgi:hypothetical protein
MAPTTTNQINTLPVMSFKIGNLIAGKPVVAGFRRRYTIRRLLSSKYTPGRHAAAGARQLLLRASLPTFKTPPRFDR